MRVSTKSIRTLSISIALLALPACSAGAGRYSVDSRALSSTWTIAGIVIGGFIIYSAIKWVINKNKDDTKDNDPD